MNTNSIGVFDSGMGGLTVLRALREALPNEHFIYLGDTARLPYGTKSVQTVIAYALQMAQVLVSRGIKLLVIACNTATVSALSVLQETYPNIPVIGVIEPAAKAAAISTKNKNIAVISTETTANSQIYPKIIQAIASDIKVTSLATGLFVSLAEEGLVEGEVVNAAIAHYLEGIVEKKIDVLVLGCTHFPVLTKAFKKYLSKEVTLIDSAKVTAMVVRDMLFNLSLETTEQQSKAPKFLVTDLPERFCRVGEIFFGRTIQSSEVTLI